MNLLKRVRKRLSDRENWTKGEWARDAMGQKIAATDEYATCWCIGGAIAVEEKCLDVANHICDLAEMMLRKTVYALTRRTSTCSPIWYNDLKKTTHRDILDLLDITIKNAGDFNEEDEEV